MGKEEFRDFLQEFSDAYVGDEIKELRFLLSDSLEISYLAIEHPSGMSFCNVLDDQGVISSTDVNILGEIAKVTYKKKAKSRVDRYIKSVRNYSTKGNGLSEFRRTLYRCLKAITETPSGKVQSDLHKLIDTYGLRSLSFNNKWDLIFHLETQKELTSNIKHLKRFINRLNTGNAKDILQEYCQPKRQEIPDSDSDCQPVSEENGDRIIERDQEYKERQISTRRRRSPIRNHAREKRADTDFGKDLFGNNIPITKTIGATVTLVAIVIGTAFFFLTVQENPELTEEVMLPLPADEVPSPSTTNGIYSVSKQVLNDLIYDVSSWWEEEGNVNMLKVLILEFNVHVRNIETNNDPYDLLYLLNGPGVISESDVSVLFEVVYVCDLLGVESKIKKHVPSFPGFENFAINKISNHRRNLIEFGKILTDKSTTNIAKLEKIKKYSDQWDLIFQLETNTNALTEKGKDRFVKKLQENEMIEEAKALNKYQ